MPASLTPPFHFSAGTTPLLISIPHVGTDLTPEDLSAAHWPLQRRPYLLETSLPGVFAAGDVRAGNIKRVASAVGEGSISISFVHRALTE